MTSQWSTPVPYAVGPTGTLRLGEATVGAAGVAVVALPGALVTVDPAAPHRLPAITVIDPAEAIPVIADLLGSAAAAHCVHPAASSGFVEIAPTPPLAWIVRLGVLNWLRGNAPWRYDDGVHRLESLVLALRCHDLLDEPEQ